MSFCNMIVYFISRLFYYPNEHWITNAWDSHSRSWRPSPRRRRGGRSGRAAQSRTGRTTPFLNINMTISVSTGFGSYQLWNTHGSKCSFVWKPWLCRRNFEYFFQTLLLDLEDRRRDTWSVTKEMTILWHSLDTRQRVPWHRDTGCLMKSSTCH